MKFTGERYVPTEQGKLRLEHYHRYATLSELATGKQVLDVACGEGYGASMLANAAARVTGVDIDAEAVLHAQSTYGSVSNLFFVRGSATALAFVDASFDMVVSFETIEHLAEQEQMLSEIRRVLRPEGILVISSPNRPVYSEESGEHNEFHVKELDFTEFDTLLKAQFQAVCYYGQRMMIGSVIQALQGGQSTYDAWHDDGNSFNAGTASLNNATYFVAVCASQDHLLPKFAPSVAYPQTLDLIQHYVGFAKWAQALDVVIAERDTQVAGLDQDNTALRAQIAQYRELFASQYYSVAAVDALEFLPRAFENTPSDARAELHLPGQKSAECEQLTAMQHAVLSDRRGQIKALNDALAGTIQVQNFLTQRLTEQSKVLQQDSALLIERGLEISRLNDAVADLKSRNQILDVACVEASKKHEPLEYTAVARRSRQIGALYDALARARARQTVLETQLKECDAQIARTDDEVVRRGEWGVNLDAKLKEANHALHAFTASTSWRVTRPMRELKLLSNDPRRQIRRYTRAALRVSKKLYQALPLDPQKKVLIRRTVAKVLPQLLTLSGSPAGSIPQLAIAPVDADRADAARHGLLDQVSAIVLPTSTKPLVSVIIPIYGKIEYTLQCLVSIAANPPDLPFEVIVVDDCSPDNSVEVLQQVAGLRLLQNQINRGFIQSCNAGARVASGSYLCFLNNDTEVFPDWLDELLRTFTEFPGTGLVGSKLIYPDGRLQEAGGIIWQDGSAWNFGRFQDPLLPVYNYAREVDYCSGASFMVPTALFNELGGFDEHYLPAYCEDADLALKIRDRGYRVIYQPASTVIHHEGITSGTDTTQGAKAYQVANTVKLYERWKDRLSQHQPNGVEVDAAKDRRAKYRVLVLDHCTPTPDEDAGSVNVFNIMLLLREMDCQVTFIPEDNFCYLPKYTLALQRIGVEVLYAPYVTSVKNHLRECGGRYAVVFLVRPGVAERNLDAVKQFCPMAKTVFHTVDLHFLRMMREAAIKDSVEINATAAEMKRKELFLIAATDVTTVVSRTELELLNACMPAQTIRLLPFSQDIPGTTSGFANRRDIMFVGGYQHAPNGDAVHFFIDEVMPLLREMLPGVKFHAVGSKPPREILDLASDDVIIAGYIENLNAMMDTMRVSVAPLRFGAGVKGKISSALASGLPVVATTLGAEGMSLTAGTNVLLADDAHGMARVIAALYNDEALWNSLSQAGLEFANHTLGAANAWEALAGVMRDIGIPVLHSDWPLSTFTSMTFDSHRQNTGSLVGPPVAVEP